MPHHRIHTGADGTHIERTLTSCRPPIHFHSKLSITEIKFICKSLTNAPEPTFGKGFAEGFISAISEGWVQGSLSIDRKHGTLFFSPTVH